MAQWELESREHKLHSRLLEKNRQVKSCPLSLTAPAFPGINVSTWRQQDHRGDDQGADDQDDKQRDGYSFPVSLWRVTPHELLKRQHEREICESNQELR